jgi:hypothetical protein
MEARNQAQFSAHMGRASEVLVPDAEGKFWIVWDSRDIGAGVPKPVRSAA